MMPVRCYTCQKVVGNKYRTFEAKLRALDATRRDEGCDEFPVQRIMEELGLHRACCRRMLLTHVPIVEKMLQYPETC